MTDDEILTSIRTRAALRRRARLAGLAAMATVLLVGGLSLAGLARSPEDAELVFAYRDESGTTTTAPSIPTDNDDVAKVLLTGDSFGYTLGYGFEGNPQTSAVAVWNQAELYCGVVPLARPAHGDEQCLPWHERAQRTLVEYGPDVVVHALGPTDVFDAVGADGQPVSVESEEYARQFQQELEEYARVVRANGARFVVLLATPFDGDATVMPPELTTARRDRVDRINALAVQALTDDAADWGHEPVIDLWTWMCPGEESGEPCRTAEDGGPLRPDGVHFDEKTARPAAAALVEPLLIVHRGVVPSGDPDELTPYGLDSNDSQATETTSSPNTTKPFPQTTTTIDKGPLPTVGPTTSTTLPGGPDGDCGEVVPIAGYPTTFLMPADGVDCFIARFQARVPARFVVIAFADNPGGGIDETTSERRTYTTDGGGTVDVTVERRSPGVGPWTPHATLQGCTQVTKVWPSAAQLTVGGCA